MLYGSVSDVLSQVIKCLENTIPLSRSLKMPVYRDYEIRLNLNELIEQRIPTCDLLHPDHCLTESQVADIAHDINMDLDLDPIFHQIDDHIMRYVKAAGINNEDHWVEKKLKDLND